MGQYVGHRGLDAPRARHPRVRSHGRRHGRLELEGVGAWTGTNSTGGNYSNAYDCSAWTVGAGATKGVTGNVGGNGSGWSGNQLEDCGNTHAIYCFER